MPRKREQLLSGEYVEIAYTDEETPPAHGEGYDNQWKGENSRKGLKFYDSTVDYMRNEWTEEPGNARSAEVTHQGQTLLLFFDERTRTWNSAEALDVDHKTPWKEHFDTLEVWSKADAMLAYNDVGNLRTIPATYNRARDSADRILDEHGVDSPQWAAWVDKKMRFDVTVDYPAYDPEVDSANRTSRTADASWTSGVKREGLAFDDSIKTTWLNHALKEAYAGEVKVPDPDHPDDRSRDHAVQLFQCPVTKQYLTRGGIDIDHEIPFTVALDHMLKQNEAERLQAAINGDEPVPGISKADVLDLYNNPENLRLMSRSANSGHEWEIGVDGQLYDPELDDVEYATPEPTTMVVGDDEPIVYYDDAPVFEPTDGAIAHDDEVTMTLPRDAALALDDDDAFVAPVRDDENAGVLKKRGRDDEDAPVFVPQNDDAALESQPKRMKSVENDAGLLSARDAAILSMPSQDLALFGKLKDEVGKLDPAVVGPLSEGQRENVAMTMVAFAREARLADIDHVVATNDGQGAKVFGVQGPLNADTGKVWFPVEIFKNQPMEVTAKLMADNPPTPQDPTQTATRTSAHSLS